MGVQGVEKVAKRGDRRPSALIYARYEGIVSERGRLRRDAGGEEALSTPSCLIKSDGRQLRSQRRAQLLEAYLVKHGGRVVDAWADPVLRLQPGAHLLLCKESEDAECPSGDGYRRYVKRARSAC
jgi:hypothetical protein